MKRYLMSQDLDCHWYLIPVGLKDAFIEWSVAVDKYWNNSEYELDKPEPEMPEGVVRINGPHRMTFCDPQES